MKQIFLHIGLSKTGSTTIQSFLAKNRDKLYNSGYLCPQTGTNPRAKEKHHHNLAWQITGRKKVDVTLGTWKELHQEVESSNLNNIIVSSESFQGVDKEQIEILKSELKPYQAKIIVYLRRQDLQLESKYIQSIKRGEIKRGQSKTKDILSYASAKNQKKYFDYYQLLEPWSKGFGISNVIVRPLERTQIPNLCQDILNIIGITDFKHFSEVNSKNIKPGRKNLEVLKFANSIYKHLPESEKRNCMQTIRKYLTKNLPEASKYRLIPYTESVKILEQYQESNQAVAQEYLGREDGILFYEQLEEYEHSDLTMEDFTKEELIILIEALRCC